MKVLGIFLIVVSMIVLPVIINQIWCFKDISMVGKISEIIFLVVLLFFGCIGIRGVYKNL